MICKKINKIDTDRIWFNIFKRFYGWMLESDNDIIKHDIKLRNYKSHFMLSYIRSIPYNSIPQEGKFNGIKKYIKLNNKSKTKYYLPIYAFTVNSIYAFKKELVFDMNITSYNLKYILYIINDNKYIRFNKINRIIKNGFIKYFILHHNNFINHINDYIDIIGKCIKYKKINDLMYLFNCDIYNEYLNDVINTKMIYGNTEYNDFDKYIMIYLGPKLTNIKLIELHNNSHDITRYIYFKRIESQEIKTELLLTLMTDYSLCGFIQHIKNNINIYDWNYNNGYLLKHNKFIEYVNNCYKYNVCYIELSINNSEIIKNDSAIKDLELIIYKIINNILISENKKSVLSYYYDNNTHILRRNFCRSLIY